MEVEHEQMLTSPEVVKEKEKMKAVEELIEAEDLNKALNTYLLKTLNKIPRMKTEINIEIDI